MLSKSLQILRSKGYKVYTEPYRLNIVGYRSRFIGSNRFDDEIHVFYRNDNHKWVYHMFKATTDPGQYWLDNPMHPQGTAFLKKGQYVDAYSIGLHRGIYHALIQTKPVVVIRNYERKGLFKWFESGTKDIGNFGINIHRARKQGTTQVIDDFSAGCLVFANADDFNGFLKLSEHHRKKYGNKFTVTLVDFRDERRRILRQVAWGTVLATGGIMLLNRLN
ncbi:hypothetical protein [Aquimarina agarilytica]|uniref:hypothetical protein n=1 Tax=Aquimarina agarilytica TaxID=1087449 RepID=UPI0002886FEF|nr:hypothetical protein [Aquimarina agarilytica]